MPSLKELLNTESLRSGGSYLSDLADTIANLPTNLQRVITHPQIFNKIIGYNPMQKETGFAAAATGLPPKQEYPGGILNPPNLEYEKGYESGEPVAIAAGAAPFAIPIGRSAGKALAPKMYEMAEDYMVKTGGLIPITAWHGTPHNIQGKFDISKVGTGEGAQAYGHGMYFAENPSVAKEYQRALSGRTDLGQMPNDPAFIHAVESFREAGYPLESIPAEMKKAYKSATDKDIKLAIQATEKGNLYKVDIPDEQIPNMLDWDKPLNQQSSGVLGAIKIPQKAADRYNEISNKLEELQWTKGGLDSPEWNKLFEEAKDIKAKYGLHRSGEELYREAYKVAEKAGAANPSQAAAESLKAQGIPGIRYLDEGSRTSKITKTPISQLDIKIDILKKDIDSGLGNKKVMEQQLKVLQDERARTKKQTSNFVVFDPSEVQIIEKNGQNVLKDMLVK